MRLVIVSGSPTVGGFGGYLSAGEQHDGDEGGGGDLARPARTRCAPAMRWCMAATVDAEHDAQHGAEDDGGGHAAPLLGAPAELGRLTRREPDAGGVLEAQRVADLRLGDEAQEERGGGARRWRRPRGRAE